MLSVCQDDGMADGGMPMPLWGAVASNRRFVKQISRIWARPFGDVHGPSQPLAIADSKILFQDSGPPILGHPRGSKRFEVKRIESKLNRKGRIECRKILDFVDIEAPVFGPERASYGSSGRADWGKLRRISTRIQWD